MNLDNYQIYFLNKENKKIHNNKINKKNNLSNDFDKLFFNFLIIIKYNIPFDYNRYIEKNIKIEIAHKMENFKFKLKNRIIENLSFDNNINLFTLYGLSIFFNLNLLFFKENIYFKMFSHKSDNYYIVNDLKDIYSVKENRINKIIEDYYEITDINKPIYSITYYKVEELQNISNKLNLIMNQKYKKKEIYYFIKNYLTNIINI